MRWKLKWPSDHGPVILEDGDLLVSTTLSREIVIGHVRQSRHFEFRCKSVNVSD